MCASRCGSVGSDSQVVFAGLETGPRDGATLLSVAQGSNGRLTEDAPVANTHAILMESESAGWRPAQWSWCLLEVAQVGDGEQKAAPYTVARFCMET